MKKLNIPISYPDILRKKAEVHLKKRSVQKTSQLMEADDQKLIHELEIHQAELEMQNEELKHTKKFVVEMAAEKYAELYDFTPSGYFTLSKAGKIIELNLSGAAMLGNKRPHLKKQTVSLFCFRRYKTHFQPLFKKGI